MSHVEAKLSLVFSQMQLRDAVAREDYVDAAKLKQAISAAEKNDAVGTALSDLGVRIKIF